MENYLNNIRAIILAAGTGSRLSPLTDNCPKSLIKVNNKPILQYQIESYYSAGIKKITIVVGYLGHKIDEFIKDNYNHSSCEIEIIYNEEYSTTNNMYSLYLALKSCNEKFVFISNGDVVVSKELVNNMINSKLASGIAYDKDKYNDESMKIVVDPTGNIIDISKEIKYDSSSGVSIDFYYFNSEVLAKLKEVIEGFVRKEDLNLWTEIAIQTILHDSNVKPIDIGKHRWCEIDNLCDLQMANRIFKNEYDG